ncbi:primosomal protein N' [Cytophagales bacterium LB-30]|uniref:Replication restart protein PriA n=1 Tax=Shiella aurantiaca TaxID=3058365 RepID=A0ABT8F4N8_9BACT|nr:primosomal protein N' [Shiella aurantiaca]MDN4165239.1 primosomal protein N' [Shiella aurantiaca]
MMESSESLFDLEQDELPFAEVLVPLPLEQYFTYRVPRQFTDLAQVGCRVLVPFGRQKVQTGIVIQRHSKNPSVYEAKAIMDVLEERPSINAHQLSLFSWIANYYLCTEGEVLQAALPSGLKIHSEINVQLHPYYDADKEPEYPLTAHEQLLLDHLQQHDFIPFSEISKLIPLKDPSALVRSLVKKEAILLFEKLKDKFSPKTVRKISLHPDYQQKEKLQALFAQLESKGNSQKQVEVLLLLLQLQSLDNDDIGLAKAVHKSELINKGASASALKTLVKNGILHDFQETIARFQFRGETKSLPPLSKEQEQAKEAIITALSEKEVCLLQGVTGSGKTEIYMHLIEETIYNGHQALLLVPEIALTTQIVSRLQQVFGDKLGVYHSRFSDNERVEVWQKVQNDALQVVVGVRSSVFLPFENLGLVIVDEEHESSYKQFDPSPRYHARDVAVVLAHLHQAKTLVASATPSLESFYLAQEGKWGYVLLEKRFADAQMPDILLADMKKAKKRREMVQDFTPELLTQLRYVVEQKEQAILFQNRRGYAPFLQCDICAHVPRCKNCDVSLTYHQFSEEVRCHYCGYKEPVPASCEACGNSQLITVGLGTEKIEEEVVQLFPATKVQRMDLDTTRSKHSYQEIIDDFSQQKTQILIGTQMVTKGLDFDQVTLVGVLDADGLLRFPDFRASERSFQTLTQVSGRAGRKEKKGVVIIQTRDVQHPILQMVIHYQWREFYQYELNERRLFRFPPFVRLITITLRHRDKSSVKQAASQLARHLRSNLGENRVSEAHEPLISRIKNRFLMEITVKFERTGFNVQQGKAFIKQSGKSLMENKNFTGLEILYDVDPY